MKKILYLILFILTSNFLFAQDTLIIQENALGQCTMDGIVATNKAGYTGNGFIDATNSVGTTISWQISVPTDGTYQFTWRYTFGGTATNYRDSKLVIDGNTVIDTIYFPYTDNSWLLWTVLSPVSVNLLAGDHKIRLEAVRPGGIANIDYFMVIGNKPTAATCMPQYVVNVASSNSSWGSVWFTPIKTYYDKGTIVTIHANNKSGYSFQCWMGEETSADSVYTIKINGNVNAIARFLPNSLQADSAAIGYSSVEDDKGTPFSVFGGALGDTVEATTITDLKTYLGDANPHVVKFSGEYIGPDTIYVKSDKTLLGVGTNAHLRNIEVRINQAQNVIIRNVIVSHVHPKDAIAINDKSKNILIDHCELFSQRGDNDGDGDSGDEQDKDWYDGLLDIKNQSSFITVSWSALHDHYKVCLMASNDEAFADSVARITFHHNYFFNCESRLPLIRFGKAHIYNNYYKDCHNAVNSRMGAWVRVEGNYFENVYRAVFSEDSPVIGSAQLVNNIFGASIVDALPACDLLVPYQYTLDATESVPSIVTANVRTGIAIQKENQPNGFRLEQNYPNPFNPTTDIEFRIAEFGLVSLKVFDVLGREVATLVNEIKQAGVYQITWDASSLPSGVYFYQVRAGNHLEVKKALLIK
jgi:pectate lyase